MGIVVNRTSQDVFNTPTLGMATTCGSLAFKDMKATSNAEAVGLLLTAGLIIIGKTNLSVWLMLTIAVSKTDALTGTRGVQGI
jgi:Asp-tRNA(Asn)/Glu-tRNA(Gln) amidotransferase A subunit family amidase